MNFARLWFGRLGATSPFYKTRTMTDEHPISENEYQKACYQITKREADNIVRAAHGKDGIKAGALRPGMALLSTKDLMMSDCKSLRPSGLRLADK
jgi:nucleoside-diphosphate-sugar epimerase